MNTVTLERVLKDVERGSEHYALMAAGPGQYAFVKLFVGKHPVATMRQIRHHNFDEMGMISLLWCHSKSDAEALREAVCKQLKQHCQPALGPGWFYMREREIELNLAISAALRETDVKVFTDDARRTWLEATARARFDRLISAADNGAQNYRRRA